MGRVRQASGPWAAALLSSATLAGCASEANDGERGGVVPAVEVVQARSGALPLSERLNGVVKADNQVSVRPEIEAVVAEVYVRSGEAVDKGQPLVRLRDDALRDQLRQAEAAVRLEEASARAAAARVAELRAQVVRTRELAEQQLVSRLLLETQEAQLAAADAGADEAQARVQQARATAEERRTAVSKTVIRSPVEGRVGQRSVEVGMLVDPAAVLFEVGNLETMRVEVPLTGTMLAHVRPGQTALISTETTGGEPIRALLSRVSPFLAAGSFSTVGEIDLSNPDGRLRPGMFVNVDILHGESDQATLVPRAALWEDPRSGERGVFVLGSANGSPAPAEALSESPQPVALRRVEVRAEGAGAVGVSGVEPGEWVVTVGQHLLAREEGARARVRRTTWERVQQLQGLQREDLLHGFMEKQRRLARTLGSELPTSDEVRASAAPPAAGAGR